MNAIKRLRHSNQGESFTIRYWSRGIRFVVFVLIATKITAQPWDPEVIWQREGLEDSSRYGAALLPLGDQNDDGFNDWAVWAMGARNGTLTDSAYVEFFHGGNPIPEAPYFVFKLPTGMTQTMRNPQSVRDLNGDGYEDWMLWLNDPFDPNDPILHWIFFGGRDAIDSPDVVMTIPFFFYPVGNFNGDGYDDLLATNGFTTDIYFGGDPFDTLPDWHRSAAVSPHGRGDLNGDGYYDILSTHILPNWYVYFGGAVADTLPALSFSSYYSACIVTDLNGDGFDEIVVGSPNHCDIMFGGPIMDVEVDEQLSFPCGDPRAPGSPSSFFSAGDVNGDGFNDLISETYSCIGGGGPFVTVHLGGAWLTYDPVSVFATYNTAAGVGDVNGDHVEDFALAGQYDITFDGWRGHADIYAGDSTIHVSAEDRRAELPEEISVSVFPNPFNSSTTIQVSVLMNWGDVEFSVLDVMGREVKRDRVAVRGLTVGYRLSGGELPSGILFVRVTAGDFSRVAKVMHLK